MKTYSEFRPTACDTKGLGLEDRQDWLVAPVSRTRDSGVLTECNWTVVTEDLLATGPEDVEIHRFGHWGPGWFEIALVRPGTLAAESAERWEGCLAEYPVASDDAFSEAEHAAAHEYWAAMSLRERVETISRYGGNIMAARRAEEIPECVYDRVRDMVAANDY